MFNLHDRFYMRNETTRKKKRVLLDIYTDREMLSHVHPSQHPSIPCHSFFSPVAHDGYLISSQKSTHLGLAAAAFAAYATKMSNGRAPSGMVQSPDAC